MVCECFNLNCEPICAHFPLWLKAGTVLQVLTPPLSQRSKTITRLTHIYTKTRDQFHFNQGADQPKGGTVMSFKILSGEGALSSFSLSGLLYIRDKFSSTLATASHLPSSYPLLPPLYLSEPVQPSDIFSYPFQPPYMITYSPLTFFFLPYISVIHSSLHIRIFTSS